MGELVLQRHSIGETRDWPMSDGPELSYMAPCNSKGAWEIQPSWMPKRPKKKKRKKKMWVNKQHSLWRMVIMWYTLPSCRTHGFPTPRGNHVSLSFYVLDMKGKRLWAVARSRSCKQQTQWGREQAGRACELKASQLTAETADSWNEANPALNGFNLWTRSRGLNTMSWKIVETFSLDKES